MNTCIRCGKSCESTYCSIVCSNKHRIVLNEAKYLLNPLKCKGCNGPIPYSKRFDNVYCSHSCSAKVNNTRREKKKYGCGSCGRPTARWKTTDYCRKCWVRETIKYFGERTLGEFNSTYARHRYQKVRAHAHRVAKEAKIAKICRVCKYSFYVELAHLKSIYSFNLETKLNEINCIDNLCFLCPNHHYELDAGILKI